VTHETLQKLDEQYLRDLKLQGVENIAKVLLLLRLCRCCGAVPTALHALHPHPSGPAAGHTPTMSPPPHTHTHLPHTTTPGVPAPGQGALPGPRGQRRLPLRGGVGAGHGGRQPDGRAACRGRGRDTHLLKRPHRDHSGAGRGGLPRDAAA
jgi:hypothetical protein